MSASASPSRAPLDRDRILDAAVAVADAEGIDAITVRRLAAVLGVHFSSLYTHVASKDAILDGMVERLLEEAALPGAVTDWRDWIRAMAGGLRRVAGLHPGAFMVLTRRPAVGPLAVRQTEAALAAFRRAGFTPRQAADAVSGASLAVLGLALNECPTGPVPAPDVSHLTREEFPHLFEAHDLIGDSSTTWELMVESLITGLAAHATGD